MHSQDRVRPGPVQHAVRFVRHLHRCQRGAGVQRDRVKAHDVGLDDHRGGFLMITEWLFFTFLTSLLAAGPPYREALPGYRYQFPRDHFEHPDFRTEWWYYTGNVSTAQGEKFGFELVFFRQGERRGPSGNPSAWRVDDVYPAHLALTDIH